LTLFLLIACEEPEPPVETAPPMVDVCTANLYACAIRMDDHSIVCWGDDLYEEPPEGAFVDVDCSQTQACARDDSGTVVCWSAGNAASHHSSPPQPEGTYEDLSAGSFYGCGITAGVPSCWPSDDARGDLPDGSYVALDAGGSCACGVRDDGSTRCTYDDLNPGCWPSMDISAVEVALGYWHGCARSEAGKVQCWGGGATYGVVEVPDESFRQISAGYEYTCGITDDLRIVCWQGSVYNWTETDEEWIPEPPSGPDYIQVSAGSSRACALTSEGVVDCWGTSAGETLDQKLGIGGW
jgi:hypothetical protein